MSLRKEGYWDEHYGLELQNYIDDGDEGEIWFGKGLSRKIVDWLIERLISEKQNSNLINIIDVGCGNAYLIYTLKDKFNKKTSSEVNNHNNLNIIGIDYSVKSIELSNKIISDKNFSKEISLKQCDFLDIEQLNLVVNNEKFDFIIDKGTFDAICLLNCETDEILVNTKLKFMESLYSLVKIGTIFILASCNHTRDELLSLFNLNCTNKVDCKLLDKIETPKIQFGGKEGSQVTCIIVQFDSIDR